LPPQLAGLAEPGIVSLSTAGGGGRPWKHRVAIFLPLTFFYLMTVPQPPLQSPRCLPGTPLNEARLLSGGTSAGLA
jgi:hypothetical protein